MFDLIFQFLSKYMPLQQEPRLILPIMGIVIGGIFLGKSILFRRYEICPHNMQLTQLRLRRAKIAISILSVCLVFLSGFAYAGLLVFLSILVLTP